ncbi:MAG: WD40 repeat domain-containing protein, partial [bacterium]|nr:WD40 repeat domain-containing protein [bacterium]
MASEDPPSRTPADAVDRCVRELTFDQTVLAVDWSPDGTRLAIGDDEGGVEILTAEGSRLWRRDEHQNYVWDVRWSPDGRRLASQSHDDTVRIWDVQEESVQVVGQIIGTDVAICWSPDGRRLASGSGEVIVLDSKTGENIESWVVPGQSASGVGWSPDGSHLAAGFRSGQIRLRDERTHDELGPFEGHTGIVRRLVWTRDSQRLASASGDNTARVWNLAERRCALVLEGHEDYLPSVSWSPDGTLLASGSADKTVRIWSSENGEEVARLDGHTGYVWTVAFSPDGTRVASAGDQTVRIWDVSDLYPVRPGRDASASFDDYVVRQAATVGRRARRTAPSLWVPRLASASGDVLGEFKGPSGNAGAVDVFPDSRSLVIGGGDSSLQRLDLDTGFPVWHGSEWGSTDVRISPDGRLVASALGRVKVIAAATGKTVSSFSFGMNSVTWPSISNLVATASEAHPIIEIWNVKTATLITQCQGHVHGVLDVDGFPKANLLASASSDDSVRVWRATEGTELYHHELHQDVVSTVRWAPDGRSLASGSVNGTVLVWKPGARREQTRCKGYTAEVDGVAWSPDGRLLASSGGDQTIRLWDPETGQEFHRFPFEEQYSQSLAWAPNGAFLAASLQGDVVRLWDVRRFLRPQPSFQPTRSKAQPIPLDLQPLPDAFAQLTRLGLPVPLSHLRVLLRLVGGASVDDATIEPLTSHPGIRELAALRWPEASRPGLVALLLKDVPRHDEWKPPPDATPTKLRDALAEALTGETRTPDAPTLPVAALLRGADAIDERLLTLLELVGPDAVAADPALPLNLLPQVSKLPAMSAPQRRLLGLRLRLDEGGPAQGYGPGIDRTGISLRGELRSVLPSQLALPEHVFRARYVRGDLLYRARTGQEPPLLRPTVIVLDVSPPVFGPIERT